jgi:hypothetical protein
MAYTFPANGGLQFSSGGKTVGVFVAGTPLGPVLLVAEKVSGDWLGRWTSGPRPESDWNTLMGGDRVGFIRTVLAAMSAAIRAVFGGPQPVPVGFTNEMNALLASNFKLDASGITEK